MNFYLPFVTGVLYFLYLICKKGLKKKAFHFSCLDLIASETASKHLAWLNLLQTKYHIVCDLTLSPVYYILMEVKWISISFLICYLFVVFSYSKLSKEVHEEEQKRVVLSRQQQFNEKYCICCFSSFGLIFRKRIKCSNCDFFACKDCMAKVEDLANGNGQGKDSAAATAAVTATWCLGCLQQR